MPPTEGETAPDFEALCCDGETFRSRRFSSLLAEAGGVLVFSGFVGSAISENWWKHFGRVGWGDFDVPVLGVTRDGPYAQNAFLRGHDLPFRFFSDVDGVACAAYDLLTPRSGMANVSTARRAVFVVDGERQVGYRWVAENWTEPVPRAEVEDAIERLS